MRYLIIDLAYGTVYKTDELSHANIANSDDGEVQIIDLEKQQYHVKGQDDQQHWDSIQEWVHTTASDVDINS